MWSRYLLDIKLVELLRFFFLFLDLLLSGPHVLKVRKIKELNPRRIHQPVQVHSSTGHGVKALLHTVRAYSNIIRKLDHLPGHALRTMADKTNLFILIVTVPIVFLSGSNLVFDCSLGRIIPRIHAFLRLIILSAHTGFHVYFFIFLIF